MVSLFSCLDHCGNLHRYAEIGEHRHVTVCYTELLPTLGGIRQDRFSSLGDLKSALIASCTAVPIAGLPFMRNGRLVMDGGFLDFQPELRGDIETITVSPFYFSRSDIRPSRYVPAWWAVYPPKPEDYKWVYQLGYNDACNWIRANTHRLPWLEHKLPAAGRVLRPRRGDLKTASKECEIVASKRANPLQDMLGEPYPSRPRERSLRRFLGYEVESRVVDFFFLLALWFIWRPIAFSVLYWELGLRCLLAVLLATVQVMVYSVVCNSRKVRRSIHVAYDQATANLCSIFSLSLLLSSIPYYNAHLSSERKHLRHRFMLRQSITYRLFHHIL
uniref:PNPLA domain-containing protein n=1 Tax=Lotharella globosa TaxID=91324 RepID=A0A7S3YPU7_9EUKA